MPARRLEQLRARMREEALEALLVTHAPNIFYLTGFQGSGVLMVTDVDVTLVTDFRYLESAREVAAGPGGPRIQPVEGSYEETMVAVVRGSRSGAVGVEAASMSLARHNWLAAALGPSQRLVPTEGLVEALRLTKDDHEIATLREAARRLSAVTGRLLPLIEEGRREREVAGLVDRELRAAGFERPAFPAIVASGPNGARPHARPGDRVLQAGDLVVLDLGGVYDGYCVDLTRTVAVGEPKPDAAAVHEAVRRAQAAALAVIRPEVAAHEVDRAARAVLEAAGLGEAFGHGTGHGLGVEVHEAPRISWRRPGGPIERLAAGMVFTVEPGAYLPGRFGVRVEDDVLVTTEGCEVLTQVSRDLRVRL